MPATTATVLGRQFSKLSSTEPSGFALLAGDALVDLWFREMSVPRLWRVNLATELDFRKTILLVLYRSEPGFGVDLLPCHFTMKERR